ncbi:MAG: type II toxin-antitoxin system VapC family toxin [bacterium]
MSTILLDTNAYGAFFSGNESVLSYIIEAESIVVSSIVVGELFAGFHGGKGFSQNRADLRLFLTKPGVQFVPVDWETAEIFGEVKNRLKTAGTQIPINDVWIAAHAFQMGAKLVTFDKHFLNVAGLRVWEGMES